MSYCHTWRVAGTDLELKCLFCDKDDDNLLTQNGSVYFGRRSNSSGFMFDKKPKIAVSTTNISS